MLLIGWVGHGPNSTCYRSRSTRNGVSKTGNPTPTGCRPSKIASTMPGNTKVNRGRLPT